MKILTLLFFLVANAHAAIKTEGEFILPLERKKYPLNELIKDYAEAVKVNISYIQENLDESKVDLYIHERTSFTQFTSLFKSILDAHGFTLIQEKGFQWIADSRDIRFLPTEIYTNQSHPNDDSYVMVLHRLKYPIAAEVTRNLRPFLSRYARVVNFADGRTIVLQEKGGNAFRLYEAINFMDTEKVYQIVLNKKPEIPAAEDNDFAKKVVELDLKNKILEKKLIEQKEGEESENKNNSNSANSRR